MTLVAAANTDMKATLEFNLPDDNYQFKKATQGADLSVIISSLDNVLRGYLKYGHTFKTADEAIQNIRENLIHDMQSYNIDIHSE